jgi:2-oxoglutarate ferredoxin oxidoreductase subunit beta
LFTILNLFLKAVHEYGFKDLSNFVFCSGIGCASWIPSPYFLADSIHTLHGRSIPVATGIKLLRPDLNLVIFGGDGDIVGIGLSHFIHAARKNLDILVIMSNNMVYGMTGGQVAPTTPFKTKTTTTPFGNFENPLDTAQLAKAVGACYSARWTTAHQTELKASIKKALQMKGFRFIEVVSQCPTSFGRRVGFKDSVAQLNWFKKNAVSIENKENVSEEELTNKIIVGEFVQKKRPTLGEMINTIIGEVKESVKKN